jgi:hypothetical protein
MQTKTAMPLLLLVIYTCGAAAGVIVASTAHDTVDSSVSISMPVQYSMAAPAYASSQLASYSLTSAAPSYKTITTTHIPSQDEWIPKTAVNPSKPVPQYSSQTSVSKPFNRRMSFSGAYAASESMFGSPTEYKPQHYQKPSTYSTTKHYDNSKTRQAPSPTNQPYISYTPPSSNQQYYQPPSSNQQYYQPYAYSKPNFLQNIRPSKSVDHDLLDFPVHSYKGSPGSSPSSYYKYLVPFALVGISLPAIGLMYTYFSRRRRRDLRSDLGGYLHPSEEDIEYYFNILQRSIQRFQEGMDNVKERRRRAD